MPVNLDYLRKWVGQTESQTDDVNPAPAAALSATLDRDEPHPGAGDLLPPLWHWLYFLPMHRHSEIGADGIVKRGGFLPPVPLPRVMHAGNRQEFMRPLHIGERIYRVSCIGDVKVKEGRTGPLVFVLVRHEVRTDQGLALTEEQEFVFRENPKPGDQVAKTQNAPSDASWSSEVLPNEMLLFRFSALTFNGHRIHYDRQYATQVEGYADLVVQGRLIVLLLADLLRRNMPNAQIARFSSRALRPLFAGVPFSVCGQVESGGKTVRLWAADVEGALATEATAILV